LTEDKLAMILGTIAAHWYLGKEVEKVIENYGWTVNKIATNIGIN